MVQPSVFVATDLSSASKLVVRRAQELAGVLEHRLVLAHVVEDFGVGTAQALIPEQFGTKFRETPASSGRAALDSAASRSTSKLERWLDKAQVKPDATRVLVGRTHTALLAAAKAARATLIVTGAHRGGSRARARLLGTTTDRLLRNSSVPVLLARTPIASGSYHRVLVGLDLGNTTIHVLRAAAALAPNGRFHLVHVVAERKRGDPEHAHDVMIARKKLLAAAEAAKLPERRWRISILTGDPREVLLDASERLEADLIALGTRANKGVKRLVLGSTAEHVLLEAHTDVLAVPPAR